MNLKLALLALLFVSFVIIGTLLALYANRVGRWWIGMNVVLHKKFAWIGYSEQDRVKVEHNVFDKWPGRGFWLFWLWGMRVVGAMIAIVGAIFLALIVLALLLN
jgi:hypothetical protein